MRLTRLRRSLDQGLFSNSDPRTKSSSPAKPIKRRGPDPKAKAKQSEVVPPEQEGSDNEIIHPTEAAILMQPQTLDPNRTIINSGYSREGIIAGLYKLDQTYGVVRGCGLRGVEMNPEVPIDPMLANLSLQLPLRSPYAPIYTYSGVADAFQATTPIFPETLDPALSSSSEYNSPATAKSAGCSDPAFDRNHGNQYPIASNNNVQGQTCASISSSTPQPRPAAPSPKKLTAKMKGPVNRPHRVVIIDA